MLKKRIIPCLDIKDGRTVKGVNFVDLRDAGDPVALGQSYAENGADELVFLDITASNENRSTLVELVTKIAEVIAIPFTVGGGIRTLEDAKVVIEAGADKVSVNTAAINRPELISEIAKRYGRQCVVVAIDVKLVDGEWMVFSNGGKKATNLKAIDWALQVEELGAGELLVTSMNSDGTKDGFEIDVLQLLGDKVNLPIIASGGAGTIQHFVDVFEQTAATGALAASVFHFNEIAIPDLKNELKQRNLPIR